MVVTWDSVNKGTNVVLSNNNLTVMIPNNTNVARATEGKTSGKWYWEIAFSILNNAILGVVRESTNLNAVPYNINGNAFYYSGGNKYPGAIAYGSTYYVNDIISVLLDLDNGTIEFWKNGVSQGIAFSDLKNNTSAVYPAISSGSGSNGSTSTARFNIDEFTYDPPEGYLAYDGSKLVDNKILLSSNEKSYRFVDGEYSNNIIPNLTSDTSNSPIIASASGFYTGYNPYKAFDGKTSALTESWQIASTTTSWLAIDLGVPRKVGKYSVNARTIAKTPKNWTFEGSNNGTSWTILDTRTNETDWIVGETREYSFNAILFRHYRINITANNGDTTYTMIGELSLFEVTSSIIQQLPSHSEQNIIKYGMNSPVKVDEIFTDKNYILQDVVSENTEGLWTTQLNRKPLSIKFT